MDTTPELELARQRKAVVMDLRRGWASVPVPPGVAALGEPGPSMGPGIDGETRWYTERQFPGSLFRIRWEHDGLWLERFRQGGTWEDDFGLYDFFNGHEMGAVEITREQAEQLQHARGSETRTPDE